MRTAWSPAGHIGAAQLREAGAFILLPADPEAAADILLERQEKYGIDDVIIPADLTEGFAPILERLR